jgi:sulfatase maturation enzyme AslB (radical SAM superfamily)
MYSIENIRHVHLEISSKCNASCPLCPRNFYGYPYNDGYIEHNMSLGQAKKIFPVDFVKQLTEVYINGNFGDAVMNPDTIAIIEYLRFCNPNLDISISTNAGARNKNFWQKLAQLKVKIIFCIDGFSDTHHLYRQNTNYNTVIKNALSFIQSGGHAVWKMIDFDHNRHQQSAAEQLSYSLGFVKFQLVNDGRTQAPVFDKNQQLSHKIGNPVETEFKILWKKRTTDDVLLEDVISDRVPKKISCQVQKKKSIYISSTGDVYPCCFLGFNPKTYGHGNYHAAANAQFRDFVQKNNALQHSLTECIEWFSYIKKSWDIPSFDQGRLLICNDVCGNS